MSQAEWSMDSRSTTGSGSSACDDAFSADARGVSTEAPRARPDAHGALTPPRPLRTPSARSHAARPRPLDRWELRSVLEWRLDRLDPRNPRTCAGLGGGPVGGDLLPGARGAARRLAPA